LQKLDVVFIGGWGHGSQLIDKFKKGGFKNARVVGLAPTCSDEPVWDKGPLKVSVFSDYREMLTELKPDLAVVSTRLNKINQAVIDAASAGCHIISEKPMAASRQELEELAGIFKEKGLNLLLLLPNRANIFLQAVKRVVDEGVIGEPVLINARKSYPWSRERVEQFPIKYGGTIGWVGIHAFDIINAATGLSFTKVTGMESNQIADEFSSCPDNSALVLETDNGGHATVSLDYHRPGASSTHGDDWIRIVGKKGTLESNLSKGDIYICTDKEDNYPVEIIKQDIAEEKPFSIQQTGAEECFEFYYILDGEVKNLYSGEVFKGGSFITINAPGEPIYLKTLTPVSFLYITNAPIFKQQSSEMSQYVQLVDEMEGKEHPIESHGKRIEKMALELGKAMDLEGENLFALIFAAYLHDVGKVKIPGSILQKKGPLNKDEWETIKKHPIWGKDLVQTHLEHQTKKKVGEIVYQHHENYDGSGYPEGLKGDEICIEAQILSLLDAYDAMTSDRPYQSALSSEEAIEEIKRNTGTQFSPKVVEKFIPLMEEMEGEKAEPAN